MDSNIIHVDTEVMKNAYDRSPGRWCDHCAMNGSHHTDRHNDFARNLLED